MVLEGTADIVYYALRDQRTYCVVKYEVNVLPFIGLDGRERRAVALGSSLEQFLHLGETAGEHHLLHYGERIYVHHYGDFIYVAVNFEGRNRMFHDGFPGKLEKLLGRRKPGAVADPAGQYYRDVLPVPFHGQLSFSLTWSSCLPERSLSGGSFM